MSKILAILKHEFFLVLPPTIFFFVAFNVIMLTKALMLRQYGADAFDFGAAAIGALLVGKVVLIVDKLPFVNRFPHKPLIYNVLWKTMIYVAAVFAVRYLEHFIPLLRETGSLGAAQERLMAEVVWEHFWVIQIWLIALFFAYSVAHELVRQIGAAEAKRMFFGAARPAGP